VNQGISEAAAGERHRSEAGAQAPWSLVLARARVHATESADFTSMYQGFTQA